MKEGIVFCKGNVEQEGRIVYLPLYLIPFFKRPASLRARITLDLSGV